VLLVCGLLCTTFVAGSSPISGRPGVVTGQIPLCYGPGPDLNLTPTVVVTVTGDGIQTISMTLPDTDDQHTYLLQLPAGNYRIRAGGWPARPVHVAAGMTTTADLPGGGCL
jgi:hypothetical protein